ncbi:MAG TPA: ABC transporter ATP-binding protein [Calidithermus sp.]|nr:ABC transporter ATP-binding protein [Calidithermus sp.]
MRSTPGSTGSSGPEAGVVVQPAPAAPTAGRPGVPAIRLERVGKVFDGRVVAVDDVSLEVGEGEFFSLLGPSGCGKTTTLRLIAGFETPDAGRLWIRGRDVTGVPPERRGTGMVFQNYALFPHRTVFENVAFGLRMRRVPRAEIARRVAAALRLVDLEGLGDRRPAQLSGGQQQRVALARALVIEPAVLLCDEPLGALDKKLRQAMQFELKQLQRRIGVSLVYVTHDQEEALTMSDRIAVMHRGRVVQVGSPREIYDRPATRFVSDFIGDSNLLDATVEAGGDGPLALRTADGLRLRAPRRPGVTAGQRVTLAVRPERVRLLAAGEPAADNTVGGTIDSANFQGTAVLYRIACDSGRRLLALEPNDRGGGIRPVGTRVRAGWSTDDGVVLTE